MHYTPETLEDFRIRVRIHVVLVQHLKDDLACTTTTRHGKAIGKTV